MSHVAKPDHMKRLYAEIQEERALMVDNVDRSNVRQVALLALTAEDVENLRTLAAADGRRKNLALLIRLLIAREAAALTAPQLPFD